MENAKCQFAPPIASSNGKGGLLPEARPAEAGTMSYFQRDGPGLFNNRFRSWLASRSRSNLNR